MKVIKEYAENRSNEKLDELLGLRNVHSRAVLLGNDSLCIGLIEFTSPTSLSIPAPNRIGFSHIALQVDDIHEEYTRLLKQGVAFRSAPVSFGDVTAVYAEDPDGCVIELMQTHAEDRNA